MATRTTKRRARGAKPTPPTTTPKRTARRRGTGDVVCGSGVELPITLTVLDVCDVYDRARSTVMRDVTRGIFLPAPYDTRPYRWRKEDVVNDLAQKAAAARQRVEATLMDAA